MNIDIQKITEGEESIVIRYRELSPTVERIIGILEGSDGKLWGRTDSGSVSIDLKDILYLLYYCYRYIFKRLYHFL